MANTAVSRQVAANAKALRKAHGLTQEALARELAAVGYTITMQAICNLEIMRRAASVDELVALAAVFKVEPATLLAPITITHEVQVSGRAAKP